MPQILGQKDTGDGVLVRREQTTPIPPPKSE